MVRVLEVVAVPCSKLALSEEIKDIPAQEGQQRGHLPDIQTEYIHRYKYSKKAATCLIFRTYSRCWVRLYDVSIVRCALNSMKVILPIEGTYLSTRAVRTRLFILQ
jgi:hypothetical protein